MNLVVFELLLLTLSQFFMVSVTYIFTDARQRAIYLFYGIKTQISWLQRHFVSVGQYLRRS